ncbi:hypothetical protein D3C72_2133670 [compost metagenome]
MSITQFKNTPHMTLEASSPVAVPLDAPVAVTSTTRVERSDGVETGIWERTSGRWATDRRARVLSRHPHLGQKTFTLTHFLFHDPHFPHVNLYRGWQ